MKANEEEPDK